MKSLVAGFAFFLVRRLLGIAVLAWAVTLAAFGLFRLGVPSQLADGQIDAQLGPGEPGWWQYAHYLLRLLHGDLGQSLTVGLPVTTVLWRALPPTLSLVAGGMLLWLVIGVSAGMVSGLRPASLTDRVVTGSAAAASIVPSFVLALLLLALSSYAAPTGFLWLQPGYLPLSQGIGPWAGRMILPWIALAASQTGLTAILTRTAVIDVSAEDYIRTAHAKGLSRRRIFWVHLLRPSVIPVLPSLSVGLGALLGSAAVIDQTFALDGIGTTLLNAAQHDDLMLVMGTTLITVILISLASLAVDIGQALLDPRIKLA